MRKRDLWKFVWFILFIGMGTAGHTDALPELLQPYKNIFEVLGWIGSLWKAYQITPMGSGLPTEKPTRGSTGE